MAWKYRVRLTLAYISFFIAIGFSLMIPHLFGNAVDTIVGIVPGDGAAGESSFTGTAHESTTWLSGMADPVVLFFGTLVGNATTLQVLGTFTVALLAASLCRGFFDFARTYTTDSLSQFVSYDFRNLIYDKLQHLIFAYHDKEHTGNLMSKATADVEAIRRFVNMLSLIHI